MDAARQVLLLAIAYFGYRLTRGAIDDPRGAVEAFGNARELIHIEQSLGIFVEASVQDWAESRPAIMDFASWMYINTQSLISVGALVYLYLCHNKSFYFVRNMFAVAFGLALIGYVVLPTAPPRFFPEWGFVDSVAEMTGVQHEQRRGRHAVQPLRRDTLDARRLRPHDRGADRPSGAAPRNPVGLGAVPTSRDLRDRGHRQPLPHRRRPRSPHGRARRVGRRLDGARPADGLGLRAGQGDGVMAGPDAPARPPGRERASSARIPLGGARRELMRNRLIESRLTPNAISVTGLILTVIAAVLIWQEMYVAGGLAYIVGSICDTLDGRYSRMSGKGSQFGAFLDSTLDRIEEGIVLTAVAAVFAAQDNQIAAAATVVAVLASLMVSYTRARAEALGVECKVGIASRAVRVVILSPGILLADLGLLAPSVYVLAALGTVTTLQRILHVRGALRAAGGPA